MRYKKGNFEIIKNSIIYIFKKLNISKIYEMAKILLFSIVPLKIYSSWNFTSFYQNPQISRWTVRFIPQHSTLVESNRVIMPHFIQKWGSCFSVFPKAPFLCSKSIMNAFVGMYTMINLLQTAKSLLREDFPAEGSKSHKNILCCDESMKQ
jgi:hypothetical protein